MIADLKPYPAYRDSGVEWLGEVPEGWGVMPARRRYEMRLGKMLRSEPLRSSDREVPYLKAQHVQWFETRTLDLPKMWANPREIELFGVKDGDLLVCEGGEGGRSALAHGVDRPTIIQNALHRARARSGELNEFLLYVMKASATAGWLDALTNKATIGHFTADRFGALEVPMPPLSDQVAVVRFLRHIDGRIQRFIEDKEQVIGLLEEERKALVDLAVTGGLDTDVATKSVTIDLPRKLPSPWGIQRLKTLASRITSGSRGWSKYAADGGPKFIRIANLTRKSIDLDWSETVHVDLPAAVRDGEGRRTRVEPGDLLLSITAYIGSVAVAPKNIGAAYVSQHVALCRLRGNANPLWVGYALLSSLGQNQGRMAMYGGTKQGLSLEDVGNFLIPLPPPDEQARIVASIDRETARTDQLIKRGQRSVSLLREYRTRLISDVVTGKLDVREAAKKLPEDPDVDDVALDERLEEVAAG